MTAPRFERFLSAPAEALLTLGSPLRILADCDWTREGLDPEAIDLQLREHDEVMLYHGTTRLLVASLGREVRFHADARYGSLCGTAATTLFARWPTPVAPNVVSLLREYVPLAAHQIDQHGAHHYKKECEGLWQNRLALIWGRRWTSAYPWIVFDREAVLAGC